MTDQDRVLQFADVVEVGRTYGPYTRSGVKPLYCWQAYTFEHVQALVAMLWPWLGERRRKRAVEVLHP